MQTENKLLAPQQALWSYLDALLQEIPKTSAPVADVEIQEWDPAELAPSAPKPVAAPKLPSVVLPKPAPAEPKIAPAIAAPPQAERPLGPRERLAWAQADFQALLFSVGGLSLAVPLVTLHSVLPWPEQGISTMPNQPAWCYGLLRYRERNVRVVNTAAMVIPPDRAELMPTDPPRHLLVVDDGRWALACSAIGDVLRLTPEQVKWRGDSSSRPWLAGTVLKHLCALVDTEAFARMLAAK